MALVQRFTGLNPPREPICSVCIANYNGEFYLKDCIDSIIAQVGCHPVEIIVHDDASTDGSVALIRDAYPAVELLVSAANVGFCVANNRMAAIARAPYLLLLNNDAALFPDAIQALLDATDPNGRTVLTLPQYDWSTGALVDRGCMLDAFHNPVPNLDPERDEVAYVIGACLWIERSRWMELGGFPAWFESIGEDLYLGCAARLRGWTVRCTRTGGYRHRQGASFGGNRAGHAGLSTTIRRRFLSERNKSFVMALTFPGPAMWPLLVLHALALLVEGALLALATRDASLFVDVYARALASVVRRLPDLRRQRATLQRERRSSLRAYLSTFVPVLRKLQLLREHGVPRIRR